MNNASTTTTSEVAQERLTQKHHRINLLVASAVIFIEALFGLVVLFALVALCVFAFLTPVGWLPLAGIPLTMGSIVGVFYTGRFLLTRYVEVGGLRAGFENFYECYRIF